MKKISSLILAGALSSVFASNYITAIKEKGDLSKTDINSPFWKKAKPVSIELYSQTTIKLNDKNANVKNETSGAKKVQVSAVYNDKDIAFKIVWADESENIFNVNSTTTYADGFALQFAKDYSDVAKLPYIGMGSKDREVIVHIQKAYKSVYEPNGNGDIESQVNRDNSPHFEADLKKFDEKVASLGNQDYQKAFISEGFRSMSEIKDKSSEFSAKMVFSKKKWEATFTRPLKDVYLDLNSGAIPVALAVWDGDKMGRDGLKHLSAWVPLKFEGKEGGEDFIAKLTEKPTGDVNKGKELVTQNCIACHNYKGSDNGMPYMAPNLSNIGGYSITAYLRESLINPNAVIVPGYNRNAHKNFAWYNIDEKGNRVSAMPSYDYLDEKSINDIVAFLSTLKEESK